MVNQVEERTRQISNRTQLMAVVEKKLVEALQAAAKILVEDVTTAPEAELRAGLYNDEVVEKWVEETLRAVKFKTVV